MQRQNNDIQAVFTTQAYNPKLVQSMQILRKQLFVDELRWDLQIKNGCEIDQFDTGHAIHCCLFSDNKMVGGFRAVQTIYPYLAKDVFPELANIKVYPQSPDIWEISRFGVLPSKERFYLAQLNYALMFWFARTKNLKSLVALTDLTYERYLKMMGIRSRRFGTAQIIGKDTRGKPLTAVAGEIPMDIQQGARYKKLISLTDNMRIEDETQIFRNFDISA